MNANRRKQIAQANRLLVTVREMLAEAAEGEREYVENMPENMREGERASRAEEVADTLDNLVSALEDHESELDDVAA